MNLTGYKLPNLAWPQLRDVLSWLAHSACLRLCVLVLFFTAQRSVATPAFDTGNPVSFFTNVGNYLLSSEFNLNLTHIQVYPTNQYTPAVHRLLQVTANIYDATTTNFYPSVFRPILERSGTNIFIAGFEQVVSVIGPNDPVFTKPYNVEALTGSLTQNAPIVDAGGNLVNVYGVPWIIGVKKNLPGLNQFSMLNAAQIKRDLMVVRATVAGRPVATNQLVQMDIHSGMGVSFWNSYSNDYVGAGPLSATVVSTVQMALTNSDWAAPGMTTFTTNWYFSFANNRWPGSMWGAKGSGQPAVGSFASVVWTNSWVTTNEAYNFATKQFTLDIQNAWDSTLSPLPQLGLLITNQLQAYIVDGTHVLDYVQLRDPIATVNVNSVLNDPFIGGAPNYYMWATNSYNNAWPSWGIVDQLNYSRQNLSVIQGIWNVAGAPGGTDPIAWSRAFFYAAWTPNHAFTLDGKVYYNDQLISQAPFTPVRTVYVPYLYQVNDPLVHYLASDLNVGDGAIWADSRTRANGIWQKDISGGIYDSTYNPVPTVPSVLNPGIAASGMDPNKFANSRYQPWGQPVSGTVNDNNHNFSNAYNLIYKDPLVWGPDYWSFPTGQTWNLNWLGKVHRGTPWQTVYLKDRDVQIDNTAGNAQRGINTWVVWTGDTQLTGSQYLDAVSSAPVTDRKLVSLLAVLLNTNDLRTQFSVNDPDPNAWTAVFDGFIVLTNSLTGLNPLVVSSNSPQAIALADAIQALHPNQPFYEIGDILMAPMLTEQSPYLNWNNSTQQEFDISDEAYEAIPSQLLPLLRTDSIGTMISTNEQIEVQFSGYDGHAYAIQVSSDLINWNNVSTNSPINGAFYLPLPTLSSQQFYRSMLIQ